MSENNIKYKINSRLNQKHTYNIIKILKKSQKSVDKWKTRCYYILIKRKEEKIQKKIIQFIAYINVP